MCWSILIGQFINYKGNQSEETTLSVFQGIKSRFILSFSASTLGHHTTAKMDKRILVFFTILAAASATVHFSDHFEGIIIILILSVCREKFYE